MPPTPKSPANARASTRTLPRFQIASNHAACPNGASVSIDINNGKVASNDAMMSASGRVADAGSINVTLSSGMKRAVGSGHLSATSGSGTWHGAMCSGTWTAQRI